MRFVVRLVLLVVVWQFCACGSAFAGLLSSGAVIPNPIGVAVAVIQVNKTVIIPSVTPGKMPSGVYNNGPPPTYVSFNGNSDPFISYHLEFTNTTGADAFVEFAFGIPIVPLGDNSIFESDLSVALTDNGDGSVSISPTYDGINASSGLQRALVSSDSGATFLTADEFGPLGPTITTAGTTNYHFDQPYSLLPPTKTFNYMEVLVGFNLSAGDSVALDGQISVHVPEPSSLTMLFSSGIGLVLFGLRRRAAACI